MTLTSIRKASAAALLAGLVFGLHLPPARAADQQILTLTPAELNGVTPYSFEYSLDTYSWVSASIGGVSFTNAPSTLYLRWSYPQAADTTTNSAPKLLSTLTWQYSDERGAGENLQALLDAAGSARLGCVDVSCRLDLHANAESQPAYKEWVVIPSGQATYDLRNLRDFYKMGTSIMAPDGGSTGGLFPAHTPSFNGGGHDAQCTCWNCSGAQVFPKEFELYRKATGR